MEYKFKTANVEDRESIAALYKSVIGTQGCTWDLNYPTIENVDDTEWLCYELILNRDLL